MSDFISLVGGAVGFFLGGPIGAAAGFTIGNIVGGLVDPKRSKQFGPRLSDLRVTESEYGIGIHRIWGTMRVNGNCFWAKPLTETEHRKKSGGKKNSVTTITYSYSGSFAIGFCLYDVEAFSRIWHDSQLVVDINTDDLATAKSSNEMLTYITHYYGAANQTPSALIQADKGAANVPGYDELAFIEYEELPLETYGNRRPNVTAEIVSSAALENKLLYDYEASAPYTYTTIMSLYVAPDGMVYYFSAGYSGASYAIAIYRFNPYESGAAVLVSNELTPPAGSGYGAGTALYVLNSHDYISHSGIVLVRLNGTFTVDGAVVFYTLSARFISGEYSGVFYAPLGASSSHFINATGTFLLTHHTTIGFYICPIDAGAIAYKIIDYADYLHTDYVSGSLTQFQFCATENYIYIILNATYISGVATGVRKFDFSGAFVSEYLLETGALSNFSMRDGLDGYIYLNSNLYSKSPTTRIDDLTDEITYYSFTNVLPNLYTTWCMRFGFIYTVSGSYLDLQIANFYSGSVTDVYSIASIVTDICEEAGINALDFDVSDLTSSVSGYAVSDVVSGREQIEPLMLKGLFDTVERDGKIVFVERGKTASATLSEDDLVPFDDGEVIHPTRQQEFELPKTLTVNYVDVDADYQTGSQKAEKIVTSSNNHVTVDLNIAMTADEAKQFSEILLKNAWIERDQFEFQTTYAHIAIDLADVVTIPIDNDLINVRITEKEISPAGIIVFSALSESGYYISNATGTQTPYPQQTIRAIGNTTLLAIDVPLLDNADPDGGFYAAVAGNIENTWTGCSIHKSTDGGINYTQLGTTDQQTGYGITTTTLASGITHTWDETNSVTIQFAAGSLATVTDAQALNGANKLLIGSEIIHAVTVVDNGGGSYTLSRLLRGRRGTEWAVSGHAANERVVVLDDLFNIPADYAMEWIYKAVTFSRTLDDAVAVSFSNTGIREKPFSPVHIKGSRDGSNNLTITWKRRSRYQSSPLWQAQLYEANEAYEIDVMSGSTVKRTISSISETASYTAAQQTADGFTPGNSITVNIYQLSATIGRGYAGNAVI